MNITITDPILLLRVIVLGWSYLLVIVGMTGLVMGWMVAVDARDRVKGVLVLLLAVACLAYSTFGMIVVSTTDDWIKSGRITTTTQPVTSDKQ